MICVFTLSIIKRIKKQNPRNFWDGFARVCRYIIAYQLKFLLHLTNRPFSSKLCCLYSRLFVGEGGFTPPPFRIFLTLFYYLSYSPWRPLDLCLAESYVCYPSQRRCKDTNYFQYGKTFFENNSYFAKNQLKNLQQTIIENNNISFFATFYTIIWSLSGLHPGHVNNGGTLL